MTWFRDDSNRGSRGDGSNREAFIGYILAANVDPAAVATNPAAFLGGETGTEPLPAYRSPHPVDSALLLDSYSVESDGSICRIVGQYSNNRRFTFPTQNTLPPTGFVWRYSTAEYVYSIPYAVQVKDLASINPPPSSGGPGSPNYVEKWVYQEENVVVKTQRVSMRFEINPLQIGNALNTIYEQSNTVQLITGNYWLCEGGDVDYDGTKYMAEISWSRERGIKINYDQLPTRTFWPFLGLNIPGVSAGGDRWGKPPFHKTIIVPPDSGDPAEQPTFIAVFPYEYDALGFQRITALIP